MTFPLWMPFYLAKKGEYSLMVLSIVYAPAIFAAGLVLHMSHVVWNFICWLEED
jgi:hypothetical protein